MFGKRSSFKRKSTTSIKKNEIQIEPKTIEEKKSLDKVAENELALQKTPFVRNSVLSATIETTSPSKKQVRLNERFRQLFPTIPQTETVLHSYSCAYIKAINIYQGLMFLTMNYICFYSKILSHETILIFKLQHIVSIAKTNYALLFPTAIRINTNKSNYIFSTFRSRTQTFDNLMELWNSSLKTKLDFKENDVNNNNYDFKNRNLVDPLESCPTEIDLLSPNSAKIHKRTQSLFVPTATKVGGAENRKSCPKFNFDGALSDSDSNSASSVSLALNDERPKSKSPPHNSNSQTASSTATTNFYCRNNYDQSRNYFFYDYNFSQLSNKNVVTVSLRKKKPLSEKAKMFLGVLIPGFFNISRIDSLLPICFLMCILLILNAFVLLNKVNQVDDLFTKLLNEY